jgi:ribonuclease Z
VKLTLLGTGVPIPDPARRGPSQVIDVGNELVLLDCGAGTVHRLVEAGYALGGRRGLRLPLRRVALTHLHSDHITGLPDLLWAGWVMGWWEEPPVIAGPPGTAEFIQDLLRAFRYDIRVRLASDQRGREHALTPRVEEVAEGWSTTAADWQLTAFRVDHAPVDQAFGYRLDGAGHAIVVSGDTRPSDNLIRYAYQADILVHEVYWRTGMHALLGAARSDNQTAFERRQSIAAYHTASDEVGKIAAQAEVKQLVLSHLILAGGSPEALLEDIAPDFDHPVTVGADLQSFEL